MAARLGEHQFDIVTGKSLNETKNRATAEALRQLKKQGLYTQTQVKIQCRYYYQDIPYKKTETSIDITCIFD